MHSYNVHNVQDLYNRLFKKIATDESFERPHGCWKKENRNGFINDLFFGIASTPIVVAEVTSCRDYAIENNDDLSKSFYSDLIVDGKRFVSLDGKHRKECIIMFLENLHGYTGYVLDTLGNRRFVRNKLFKDLNYQEQQRFYNSQLCITTYTDLSRKDLSKVFLSLNANAALTNQHKRNALQTMMSGWTRKMSKQHQNLMISLFGEKSLPSMKPEEFISKLYLHCDDVKNDVGDSSLNRLYQNGIGKTWHEAYSGTSKQITQEVLKNLTSLNSVIPIPKNRKVCFVLATHSAVQSGFSIDNEQKFVTNVSKLDEKLEDLSRKKHVEDKLKDPEVSVASYYFEQMRLNWNHQYRFQRQNSLWEEILKDPELYGLIKVATEAVAK